MVEMAITIILLGFLMTAAMFTMATMLGRKTEISTLSKMETIADAIAIYAQHNMRIPCPANPAGAGPEPFGAEWGSTATGTAYGNCRATPGQREGIVPWFTLGIPESYARDTWGNFFTYRVSPTATNTPLDANIPTTQTGLWCLVPPAWYDTALALHINPPKAAFCCGTNTPDTQWDQDIILTGPHGIVMPSRQTPGEGGEANDYRNPTAALPTAAQLQGRFTPIYPAYVLVSHGQNSIGAFGPNGAHTPGGASAPENENRDGDNTFFITDRISPRVPSLDGGTDLYRQDLDDIVFWQSQAQVMSRLGETSCARPWNL